MTSPDSAKEFHLHIDNSDTLLLDLLASTTGKSKTSLKQILHKGACWLTRNQGTRRLRRAKTRLHKGDQVHLYINAHVLEQTPPEAKMVHDAGSYSAWIKPPGMWSQGSRWGDHCSIQRWVETHLQPERPCFVIHRLDKAAAGLMLIAHSKKMASALSRLFAERRIEKTYQVFVHGSFEHELWHSFDTPLDDKPALSHARLLRYNPEKHYSHLEVRIETGRKHQIRRHLSAAGFPVLGDHLHGKQDGHELALLAVELKFTDPNSNKEQHFTLQQSHIDKALNHK